MRRIILIILNIVLLFTIYSTIGYTVIFFNAPTYVGIVTHYQVGNLMYTATFGVVSLIIIVIDITFFIKHLKSDTK